MLFYFECSFISPLREWRKVNRNRNTIRYYTIHENDICSIPCACSDIHRDLELIFFSSFSITLVQLIANKKEHDYRELFFCLQLSRSREKKTTSLYSTASQVPLFFPPFIFPFFIIILRSKDIFFFHNTHVHEMKMKKKRENKNEKENYQNTPTMQFNLYFFPFSMTFARWSFGWR